MIIPYIPQKQGEVVLLENNLIKILEFENTPEEMSKINFDRQKIMNYCISEPNGYNNELFWKMYGYYLAQYTERGV